MDDTNKIFKKLNIEENIWVIYLIIITLSFYSNSLERKFYKYGDNNSKKQYRKINIIIFLIALCVYIYFFTDSFNDVMNLNISDTYNKKFFNKANLTASTLILIAGTILLFIAIFDIELDTELAFS